MSNTAPIDAGRPVPRALPNEQPAPLPKTVVVVGFGLMALSFMINAMDRQVFAPLLPIIRSEFGFSLSQSGLLATGFTLGLAVAGLPAGYLVDRFSRKTVLVVSIVIYSLGTLALSMSTGFLDMSVYRIVSGLGEGMQAAALFAAVGAYFGRRRGFALGAVGFAFGLGVILGPLLGVHVAAMFDSWRAPFVAFGVAGLAVALISSFALSRGMTERDIKPTTVSGITFDYMPASPFNRNSICLAIASAIAGVVLYGFLGLYPTFLVSELKVSTAQSALALSFVGFGGLLGLVGGWLGDRVNQRTLLIVGFVAVSVISIFIYQVQATLGWQCLFAFVMGVFGTGVLFPNINSAMQRAVRPHQVGRAAGLFVTSYYGTAAFSGLTLGWLANTIGWRQAGFWQITVLPLIGIAALLFVRTDEFNNAARPAVH
ncbi:MAG TPA: MFS transporter [Aldersonia sp.]